MNKSFLSFQERSVLIGVFLECRKQHDFNFYYQIVFYAMLLCGYGKDIKQCIEKKAGQLTDRFCESIAFIFFEFLKTFCSIIKKSALPVLDVAALC